MPPKKGEPVLPAVPEVEDEFVLPDEVEPVAEPSFCFALGHLVGHKFVVEEPRPPPVEGEEPQEIIWPPPVREFDPCSLIIAKAKEPGDALLKRIICIEREDLELVANAEDKTLAAALQARLEKEHAARHRRKYNDARRAAVAAFEAAQTSEVGDAAAIATGETTATEEKTIADTLVILRGYPSTQEELDELSALGLCTRGLVNLWAPVYVAGETLGELPEPTDEDDIPERPVHTPEPPDLVRFYYDGIHSAALNTDLSNCSVCVLQRSNTLAVPPAEVALVDHVANAILEAVGAEAASRQKFNQWMQAADMVPCVPTADKEKKVEKRLYERLMGSADPLHHDVPLFLHCLTEQVALNVSGTAEEQEEGVAMSNLNEYLGVSCSDILSGGMEPMRRPQSRDGPTSPKSTKSAASTGANWIPADDTTVLPHLDRALCAHSLAGGGILEGGEPIINVVHRVLQEVSVPGLKRSGLPPYAIHSTAQREALKTRIYPFAPILPPSEFEQLLLLHAFEDLMNKAQPERKWQFSNRTYHERIPKGLLAQTLDKALQSEPFVSTVHVPRHDCLLVALHHRSLPGRVMWHSWKGDLSTPSDSIRWGNGLFTTPTFNDWQKIVGGNIPGLSIPQPCRLLEGMDGREFGYLNIIEKLATPSDRSIILVTRCQHGLKESFPYPSAASFQPPSDEPATILDGESGYDLESVLMFPNATATPAAEKKFDAPVRYSSRLARVLKEGLVFGIVPDATWAERRETERNRRLAIAGVAAESAKAGAAETSGSRPQSPGMPEDTALDGSETQLPWAGHEFGVFWLSFPDGARCTVRMHHEKALFPANELDTDPGFQNDSFPPLGTMFTYSMANGLVIQVFSDGAMRFTWPLALQARDDGPAIAPVATAEKAPRLPAGDKPYFLPGCPEDIEVMRTITPVGTVIRKLLSGRTEVFHSDSTTAVRNPTSEELHAQLAELRTRHGPDGSSRIELLERFCKVYATNNAATTVATQPSEKQKAAGLPGHWVVIRPDGSMFGRVALPDEKTSAARASPAPSDGQLGSAAADARASPAPSDGPPGSAAGGSEPRQATPQPEPQLHELLGGVIVDGVVEYEIKTGVSVATQVDLQTQHRTRTNSHGLASYEDPDGLRTISDHADGTRVTKIRREGGHDILISKEPMALVKCEFNDSQSSAGMRVIIQCADGAQLEVVPQTLSPSSGLLPLRAGAEDWDTCSSQAWVLLKRPDTASIISKGDGGVEILAGVDAAQACDYNAQGEREGSPCYTARCAEGCLNLEDEEGQRFTLAIDQTLSSTPVGGIEPSSPRCILPNQAYKIPGLEEMLPPDEPLQPRLFVVYGNGDAEELISDSDAIEALNAAKADPQATVVEGEVMGAPMEGCKCHTVFSTKKLDGYIKPPVEPMDSVVTLSLGSLDSGWSLGSAPMNGASTEGVPTVTKFRQIIEYPGITEDVQQKFLGTLKQYRQWEQAELMKNRAVMAGPEDKKNRAAEKKASKKSDKKDDKKAKRAKKRQSTDVPVAIVELALPKFVEDLNLPVFDHAVQVLRIRQALVPEPTNKQLLAKALSGRDADVTAVEDGAGEIQSALEKAKTPEGISSVININPNAETGVTGLPPVQMPNTDPEEMPAEPDAGATDMTMLREQPPGDGEGARVAARPMRPKLTDAPTFSYFKSEMGLQFLLDTGELDPERRPPIRKEKTGTLRQASSPTKRNPWSPLLLGEVAEDEAQQANDDETEFVAEKSENRRRSSTEVQAEQAEFQSTMGMEQPAAKDLRDMPYTPQARLPIVAEDTDTPDGPHPDKKGNLWDIYGQPRKQRPVASHAYVSLNTDYLEIEGETDRRVRTASISHKKNSAKAPSVASVRKTGQHALGMGNSIAAKEILGDLGLSSPEEHWKLTSTMQGLGDSNNLVEVTPGTCRFGPVRQGGVYRMHFYLRNLDVDVTRYNVGRVKSDVVNVIYQPGHIAPGMAAKVTVEIIAKQPMTVEQLVEVRMKAHVVRVPVTARILEAEEYDRLDAESFVINRRHIGRHREKSDAGEKRAVEVVADDNYCRKVLGSNFLAPPPDFEETPMQGIVH